MSSVAGRLSGPGRSGALARRRAVALPLTADAVVCTGAALVVSGVAFAASGGNQLERTTHTEIALILGGALLAALALARPGAGSRRLHGAWTLVGLAALAALTSLSITWSIVPSESWFEANRMLGYLGAFAGALALVHLAPGRWAAVLGGVALACVVVAAWALLTKVFPAALSPDETFGRLRAPFDYWNAVGLMGALGVPPLLWLAAKRSGNRVLNALAYPGLGIVLVCVLLSYSRGALLALVIGAGVWFAVVPLRLRAAAALVAAALAAALVVAWAFAEDALTSDGVPLPARTEAGHELGAALVLMCVVLLVVGLATGFGAATRRLSARARLRLAGGLVFVLGLIPILGVIALATAPGGIGGQVSKGIDQLTDPAAITPSNTPGRLTATSSVRSRYWREALDVFAANRARGTGAGTFAVARTRYRTGPLEVRQAHGYVVETAATLGLAGLAVSLALLAIWLASAVRATGLRRRDRDVPVDAESVGLRTLMAVVVLFGAHSVIDWTWFVPGTAVVALVCAAWVAGRGPLRARLGSGPVAGRAVGGPPLGLAVRRSAAALVLMTGVAAAWAAYQPLRSANATDAAYDRLERNQAGPAVEVARLAVRRNPLSVDALFDLSAILTQTGRPEDAEQVLERAVELQPANSETWRRLAEHRVLVLDEPKRGLPALRAAYYLDPQSKEIETAFVLLRRQLAAPPPPPPPPPTPPPG